MGLFSLINGLEAAFPAADAAQARAPEAQQTVHFLGSVPVNAVLVVDQNVIGLPDLPRRLFPCPSLWHDSGKKGTEFFHPLDFVSLS